MNCGGSALATFMTGASRTLPSHRIESSVSFAMLKQWEGNSGEILLVPGAHKRFYVNQFLLEPFEVGRSY